MKSFKTIITLLLIFQYRLCQSYQPFSDAHDLHNCPKGTHSISVNNLFMIFDDRSKYTNISDILDERVYCKHNSDQCLEYNKEKISCEKCTSNNYLIYNDLTGDFCVVVLNWTLVITCLICWIILMFVSICILFLPWIDTPLTDPQVDQYQQFHNVAAHDISTKSTQFGF